jgi:hypothetical protein
MGLDGEQPWDARSLTDVVRGTATITSMAVGRQLILLLMAADREGDRPEAEHSPHKDTGGKEIILALGGDSIVIVGVKNRWKHAVNGWRDAQIKFYFRSDPNKHVCELQLSHQLLANVRKGMGMHKVYAKSRNAVELLEALRAPPRALNQRPSGGDGGSGAAKIAALAEPKAETR